MHIAFTKRRCIEMKNASTLLFCITSAIASKLYAYDPPTHSNISTRSPQVAQIGAGEKLTKLAIPDFNGNPLFGGAQSEYPDSQMVPRSIGGLIQFGSTYEDDRSLLNGTRHFFNPLNGQGLITPVGNFISSPDWILADRSDPGHDFTWKKARSDFLKASTDPSKAVRKQFWGLTFQKLAHVIHHVQDMAQPQHAHNDPHCEGRLATLRDSLSSGANCTSVVFVAV
jgi:hypothetical protein